MPASSRGNWSKVAIGGLVLLNIVLLALLVLREPSRTVAAVPVQAETTTPSPTRSAGPRSPSPAPSATTSSPSSPGSVSTPSATASKTLPPAVRSTRVLAVNSARLAWRGTFGSCPTTPAVEVSRDGGRTWKSTSVGLRSVSRLRSYSESSVFAVGGSDDCEARYVAAGGPGESWEPNESMLGATWYRQPGDTNRVHAPGGRTSSPCGADLGDLAGLGDDNAAAVCSDGVVRTTSDNGRTWRELKGGENGLAVAADDGSFALALGETDCEGLAVAVLEPGSERVNDDDVRCAPVEAVSGGELAVAIRDQVVWVWAGSEVAVSTDRGRTWSARSAS